MRWMPGGAVGTPGGSRIITAVMHVILNVIDYGMDIQEAVDAPRFHQQWLPDTTFFERFAFSPDTRAALESWGQDFRDTGYANHVMAILIGARNSLANSFPLWQRGVRGI